MKTITQIPFLNEVLSLGVSERMFVMNKIYESLINDLPNPKKIKDNKNEIPDLLKANLDLQTKEFKEGKLKTFSWDEVLVSVRENKKR